MGLWDRDIWGGEAGTQAFQKVRTPCPLSVISLSNVRSLANKSDELQLLMMRKKGLLSLTSAFFFLWLNASIPDTAVDLAGFQLNWADPGAVQ